MVWVFLKSFGDLKENRKQFIDPQSFSSVHFGSQTLCLWHDSCGALRVFLLRGVRALLGLVFLIKFLFYHLCVPVSF